MQYLKDEVREGIVTAALAEFKAKGYGGASMREIASRCGITPGNIYRYFDGKEALFEAVVSPVNGLLLNLINSDPIRDGLLDVAAVMEGVMNLFEKHSDELLVLFFAGEGSKYESVRSEMIRLIDGRLVETLFAGEPDLAFVVSSSFFEGVLVTLRTYDGDNAKIREIVRNLISLFFEGRGFKA